MFPDVLNPPPNVRLRIESLASVERAQALGSTIDGCTSCSTGGALLPTFTKVYLDECQLKTLAQDEGTAM
jgi:hypothetical protein